MRPGDIGRPADPVRLDLQSGGTYAVLYLKRPGTGYGGGFHRALEQRRNLS